MPDSEHNLFNAEFDVSSPTREEKSHQDKISGEIVRVVFVSEDETYSVIRIKANNGRIHTVVGSFSGAFEGQGIVVKGKWEDHREHGQQFRASKFNFTLPVTSEGIEKYLSSGLIPGIGPKRAEMIVARFKEKTLDILDNHSARLLEIPGFGKKTLKAVRKSWLEHADKREIVVYFQGLGISLAYCQKIYKRFGSDALSVVKNNPYKLADEVTGIGFLKADNIAKNQGVQHNDDKRLRAGIRYSLGQLSRVGHVCYPEEEFLKYTAELLDVEFSEAERGLHLACQNKTAVIDTVNVDGNVPARLIYSTNLFLAERELADIIPRLVNYSHHKGTVLRKFQNRNSGNMVLNKEQFAAVNNVATSPISIITGGPGVGKTTVISEVVNRTKLANLKILLAAPTGRAAKRLSESTNIPACTIHRLLKWEPIEKNFVFNQNNKLFADILVIDEVSMLDVQLAVALFKAVAPGTTVVLVGDSDQLPSVGPGNILHDIISSSICPVTKLIQVYRQDSDSKIIPNAHAVNCGRMIDLSPQNPNILHDFYWIEQEETARAAELIVKMVKERIPKRFGIHPFRDIQILSPMTKGECGTIKLNELIQSAINPGPCPQFEAGNRVFKAGDKVMQISNNYDKKVFNGDIGFIYHINIKDKLFSVKYDGLAVQYEFSEAEQLKLAYAITIHKSQGSEFPAVIVPCLTAHFIMLQRNLIYTAITRAKKLLIIIGSKKALAIAINNFRIEPRYSAFLPRLQANMKKYKILEF
jgi:exodeoxyribonuclease V alpha subunit